MKLIAGFVALVAAEPKVIDCNAGTGGAAAMSMTIAESDVQQAPTGWAGPTNGVYSKIAPATTTNTAMGTTAGKKELVMTETVNSGGCEKVTVDNIEVCKAIGHVITFTCTYPMDDQVLKNEKDFSVSGSDTEKTATKTGTLNYKLTVDKTAFNIGAKVTATITPATPGLVHATIESCSVKNKVKNESVKLIDDGLERECALGVDVTTGQGNGNLGFTWSSFKWSTTLNQAKAADSSPNESQDVSCSISLSKATPAKETQNVCTASSVASTDTWTKTAGEYCLDDLSYTFGDTLDECKTKCLSESLCKFFTYTKMDEGTCFVHSAEQCAQSKRMSDTNYDIYKLN